MQLRNKINRVSKVANETFMQDRYKDVDGHLATGRIEALLTVKNFFGKLGSASR